MGNEALIARNGDPYDSGIDSDEGKIVGNSLLKDEEKKEANTYKKPYSELEKIDRKADGFQRTFTKKYSNRINDYMKWEKLGDHELNCELHQPLMESYSTQEQMRMSNLSPDPPEPKWTVYPESDNDRSSPQLYEVELTASDEDDSSVLELVIPLQSRVRVPSRWWVLDVFCFCCFHYV